MDQQPLKPAEQGFCSPPEGKLLNQILDLKPAMGLAYERSISFEKKPHTHSRPMLVCPRGACRMSVGIYLPNSKKPKERIEIDSNHVLWVPEGLLHDDVGLSTIYDTFAIYPNEDFIGKLPEENGIQPDILKKTFQLPIKIRRNRWLNDLLERYFYERILNHASPLGCTFYLEKQLLNEFVRLALKKNPNDAFVSESSTELEDNISENALRFIETHLFEKIRVSDISQYARTSDTTLTRNFKRTFGQPPLAYIKSRRLDEALALLKGGKYQVQDVCLLVGYEDLASFSKSFKAKFGKTPLDFLPHRKA